MFFILFFWPILEVYLFFQLGSQYGYLDLIGLFFLDGFVGAMIMYLAGSGALRDIQMSALKGEAPSKALLHRGFIFLGGLLIFLPGVLSDVIGVLLILPGLRHLLVWHFMRKGSQLWSGLNVRVFSQEFGGPFTEQNMRDVSGTGEVIDITNARVISTTVKNSDDDSSNQ